MEKIFKVWDRGVYLGEFQSPTPDGAAILAAEYDGIAKVSKVEFDCNPVPNLPGALRVILTVGRPEGSWRMEFISRPVGIAPNPLNSKRGIEALKRSWVALDSGY